MLRRRMLLAPVAALLFAALGACTAVPQGVDKNLVDEWAAMAEAKVPEPKVGDCWTTTDDSVYDVLRAPSLVVQTPCEMSHFVETVHVGQYTGTFAAGDRVPGLTESPELYKICDTELTKFLGAAWQTGRVMLIVAPPTANQWRGGARFYRCDVAGLRTERGVLEARTKTLKGTLQAGGELLLGCSVQVGKSDEGWDDLSPTPCTAPHDVEFMGAVDSASGTYPADVSKAYQAPCQAKVRSFTGMNDTALGRNKVSFGYWMTGDEDEWKVGNRVARCYLMLPKKISRSLQGAGNITV